MLALLIFLLNGQEIARYPVLITGHGFDDNARLAFEEFAKAFPNISVFDERLTFRLCPAD